MNASRARRVGLALLLVVLLLLATAQGGRWFDAGAPMSTAVTDLVPTTGLAPAALALYRQMIDRGGSRIVLMLEAAEGDRLEDAAIALEDALLALPGIERVDARPDPGALLGIGSALAPYRQRLLSAEDRGRLAEHGVDALRQWLDEAALPRLLPSSLDPLGTLGRFLAEGLRGTRLDSDGFYYWAPEEGGQAPALVLFVDLAAEGGDAATVRVLDTLVRLEDAHGVAVHAAGAPLHALAARQRAMQETRWFGGVGMALVALLLLGVFRTLSPLLRALLVVAIALGCGLAAATAVFAELHVLALVMAVPVIGVAVDYLVHAEVHRRAAVDDQPALPASLLRALAWGCVTSALGYAAIGTVEITVLRQVAVVLVVGLASALLAVVVLAGQRPVAAGGAVKAWLDGRLVTRLAGRDAGEPGLAGQRRAWMTTVVALAVAAGLGIASGHRTDNAPATLHRVDAAVAADEQRIADRLGMPSTRSALRVEGTDGSSLQAAVEHLVDDWRADSGQAARGLATLAPSPSRQQDNQRLLAAAATGLDDGQRRRLAMLEAAAPPPAEDDLAVDALPAPLHRAMQNTLPPYQLSTGTAWALVTTDGDPAAAAAWCMTRDDCRPVDALDALATALADTHLALASGLAAALAALLVVLALRYHRRGLLAWLALATAVGLAWTLPALLGLPRTLLSTAGVFVLLGLAVDYVVFLLEGPPAPRRTWLAIVVSAATTVCTFGVLMASTTPAVRMLAAPVLCGLPAMLLLAHACQRSWWRRPQPTSRTEQ